MIQTLLCWRYLRTRWIALASIVSVTLGVATLIVVNSVMDGFTEEMRDRIHGILSDVVIETRSSEGIANPGFFEDQVRRALGDQVEGMTTVVALPAMMTFQDRRGQSHTQQINLIGIDRNTYSSVSDFSQYLIHPQNRKGLDFDLKESGYEVHRPALLGTGWEHRKRVARLNKELQREREHADSLRNALKKNSGTQVQAPTESNEFTPPTSLASLDAPATAATGKVGSDAPSQESFDPAVGPSMAATGQARVFDAEVETHTGIVLGVGLGSCRVRDELGEVIDYHYLVPGDDVTIAMPNAGTPPRVLDERFTIVDFYESQMSEYDSTFAFVPIEKLQQVRGMIDPISGARAVSSIQIKLKPDSDLAAARDKLQALFPVETTLIQVSTWKDSQGPLLAAVQMETTILNILLFMIIAVAGFGILATFFMIVVEKTRDIGILKSLGASGSSVAGIFLAYGLLLGLAGSSVGAVLGLLFVRYINDIAALLEVITGQEVFDPTVYYFTKIPTVVHSGMIVWVVLGAVAIAVLASVLPSIRAARMHPVEALRYE